MDHLNIRFEQLKQRIATACQRASRDPSSVTLIAATKGVPAERISQAIRCGIKEIGENYLQEATAKREKLPPDLTWHFIGSIQKRKVRSMVGHFEWIHSVDRWEIANEIHTRASAIPTIQKVLVQVNTSGEATKSGVSPENVLPFVERLKDLRSIDLRGLMTIPPWNEDPEASRPYFKKLSELLKEINARGLSLRPLTELSIGMSGDFEVAIEEGATMIRIGTALFGPRPRSTT